MFVVACDCGQAAAYKSTVKGLTFCNLRTIFIVWSDELARACMTGGGKIYTQAADDILTRTQKNMSLPRKTNFPRTKK